MCNSKFNHLQTLYFERIKFQICTAKLNMYLIEIGTFLGISDLTLITRLKNATEDWTISLQITGHNHFHSWAKHFSEVVIDTPPI